MVGTREVETISEFNIICKKELGKGKLSREI